MKAEQREFFNIMTEFRKMNISSILPEINHGDAGILRIIKTGGKFGEGHCMENLSKTPKGTGIKVSTIVEKMHIPAPAVSRSLRNLEDKGYIERTIDKEDRRNTYVNLTEEGERVGREIDEIMGDFAAAVFGEIGEERMQLLNRYLGEFCQTAKAEIVKRKYKGRKEEAKDEENI